MRRIVAAGLVAAGFLGASATAQARPTIYVIEPGSPTSRARPALGLYVPGAGGTVSRAGTIAALRRGKVENAALGGRAGGKILADVVFGVPDNPVAPAAYVTLPPSGTHPNTTRYLVAIAGADYHGILTSRLDADPWPRVSRGHRPHAGRTGSRALAADRVGAGR